MNMPSSFRYTSPPSLAWVWLGLSSLLLSSCFGLFLVFSRTPWLSQGLATTPAGFSRALVYHVNFAVLIWFLAMAGAFLTRVHPPGRKRLDRIALVFAWSGAGALLLAGIDTNSQAILSNYVPVLTNFLFMSGLGLLWLAAFFLTGHGLSALWNPSVIQQLPHEPVTAGTVAGSLAWLASLVAFLLVTARLATHPQALTDFNTLFWAGGHLVQLGHVSLLLSVWLFLLAPAIPHRHASRLVLLIGLSVLPSVIGLAGLFFFDIPGENYHMFFTLLMKYASWWAVPGTFLVLRQEFGMAVVRENDPVKVSVLISMVLMLLGMIVGVLIQEDTVLVTAHYHAAVGAVTLGYMGLARRLLVEAGVIIVNPLWLRRQPWLFGVGVFLLTTGLAISGLQGIARKTPGLATASWEEILGMTAAGIGGSLAMAGVVIFCLFPLHSGWRHVISHGNTRDFFLRQRNRVIIMTVLAIGLGSQLLERLPPPYPPAQPVPETASPNPAGDELLRQRFMEGAMMLQGKRYNDAIAVFHDILQQHPRIPEAHVNMGFALLGSGKTRAALDFFQGALALNPYQTNAYYGLAEALEAQGDLETALGAMRSFVHMTHQADDPWLTRARSALWEWEEKLKNQRQQANPEPKANPVEP
ncbi:MAG: TPR REGION protein [Magnetococcales bacterium]|nr:TPR REGION protein [Magnetococcales bacterium]HIJ85890.1 tetratricopeptide repeat protein [Magnetococcales bacterium]